MSFRTKKHGRLNKASKPKNNDHKILNAFQIAEHSAQGADPNTDGDLAFEGGVMDARKFLKENKDEDLDDEELDSDGAYALGEEDVLDLKFSQSIRDGKKAELDYDSVDESELVTLSEAFDMAEREAKQEAKGFNGKSEPELVMDDESGSDSERDSSNDVGSDSSDDSGNDSSDDSEGDSDSEAESAILRGSDDEVELSSTLSKLKKMQGRKYVADAREENEFAVGSGQLSINDLMAGADKSEAVYVDLEEAPLSMPLPKRIQDRHDRKAAYELTKEAISKWEDSVKALQEADHLEFPLVQKTESNEEMRFVPEAAPLALEDRINGLLKAGALLDESKEATFQQMAAAKLSKDEVFKRTQELRRMRELMFRDEQRAKRIKKIKSKTYRKIHKKERLREAELMEEPDEDHDVRRAEERMLLKHKTQLLWAKKLIKLGISKDSESRQELEEMLRRGEQLRARQLGDSDGELLDIEREYANDEDDEEERQALGKGVMAMDFMRAAEEKRRKANLREIAGEVEEEGNIGRRSFVPTVDKVEMEEIDEELRDFRDEETGFVRGNEGQSGAGAGEGHEVEIEEEAEFKGFDEEEENPWLEKSAAKLSTFTTVTEDSLRLTKAAHKIKKRTRKDEDATEISVANTISADVDERGFQQHNLVKEAFAGDDVVAEFALEKRKLEDDEDDQEVDVLLPGWGDWAGADQPRKKKVLKVDGVVQKDKRKDRGKHNVIINEAANKPNLKYQSLSVPYPFESKEQYERALRMPVGEEWAPRNTFQKSTKPRVSVKQGVVVDPLTAPF